MARACPRAGGPGVGITAMRERVAELRGELAIEPRARTGPRIVACLPAGGHRHD